MARTSGDELNTSPPFGLHRGQRIGEIRTRRMQVRIGRGKRRVPEKLLRQGDVTGLSTQRVSGRMAHLVERHRLWVARLRDASLEPVVDARE